MVFNSEIERKIVDFVKKSTFGVSSSEIGRYLGLNRITLTKYLAVIKEKALIDFKPFGMAKLWYIPVKITRESLFTDLLTEVITKLDEKERGTLVKMAGLNVLNRVEEAYRSFYNVKSLNLNQVLEAVKDLTSKIDSGFTLTEQKASKLIFKSTKDPFKGKAVHLQLLYHQLMEGLFGTLIGKNLGYAKVVITKSLAKGDEATEIVVFLKKTKESSKVKGVEFKG